MDLPATVIGYCGTACLVLSFQCKTERRLFLCQMLSGLLFVLHYGLLGDYTGMVMDGVCFVRSLMMISGKKLLKGRIALCTLLAVILALGVLTWDGIFSLFPTVALLVSTVFLYSDNTDIIRRAQFFCTSPCWLTYNIHVLSWPGILCESLDMASCLVFWCRSAVQKRKIRTASAVQKR